MNATKLADIAEELGLSVSTVSRALSGNGRVGEDTRKRVLEAVKESAYTPNAVARSLRLRDAMNIGVIVPDIANTYYAAVIKGAQGVCRESGYTLMVCNSDENVVLEEEALYMMLEKQVSGLILATVGCTSEIIGRYGRLNIPVVFFDNLPSDVQDCDSVSIDNHDAAYRLTGALIARGYTQIGLIAGPVGQTSGRLRLTGFTQAMQEAGLFINPDWVREGDFKLPSGRDAMRAILSLNKHPRAMLISNNYMTYGAVGAIREAGLSIPQDIAVAAFDALDITGLITPKLTSINQPAEEIGVQSAQIILNRLSEKDAGPGIYREQQPVIVEGESW
ncbi:MAG: LacI family DNA-binding transcriptional regulator [Clostridia bacterium]